MKRYEVSYQLMDSDFPRSHQYTGSCRVYLQAGQHLSGGLGHCQANPDPPSILSLYESRLASGPEVSRSRSVGVCLLEMKKDEVTY